MRLKISPNERRSFYYTRWSTLGLVTQAWQNVDARLEENACRGFRSQKYIVRSISSAVTRQRTASQPTVQQDWALPPRRKQPSKSTEQATRTPLKKGSGRQRRVTHGRPRPLSRTLKNMLPNRLYISGQKTTIFINTLTRVSHPNTDTILSSRWQLH